MVIVAFYILMDYNGYKVKSITKDILILKPYTHTYRYGKGNVTREKGWTFLNAHKTLSLPTLLLKSESQDAIRVM